MQEVKQPAFLGTTSPPSRKTPSAQRTSRVERDEGVSTEGLDCAYRQKCSRTNVIDTRRTTRSRIGLNWKMIAILRSWASINLNPEGLSNITAWPTICTRSTC